MEYVDIKSLGLCPLSFLSLHCLSFSFLFLNFLVPVLTWYKYNYPELLITFSI